VRLANIELLRHSKWPPEYSRRFICLIEQRDASVSRTRPALSMRPNLVLEIGPSPRIGVEPIQHIMEKDNIAALLMISNK
jgi:hypothetical protein